MTQDEIDQEALVAAGRTLDVDVTEPEGEKAVRSSLQFALARLHIAARQLGITVRNAFEEDVERVRSAFRRVHHRD